MAYHVVIPRDISEPGKAYLRARGYRVTVGTGSRNPDEIRALITDADAILARTGDYSASVLSAAKNLRVIGRHGVGMDGFDLDYCRAHGVRVVNAPNANSESVAEHTVGQMLALSHRFLPFDRAVRAGDFSIAAREATCDLYGKTLGVVGVGNIGRLVAMKAMAGFSMKTIGYAPRPPKGGVPIGLALVGTLDELFERADYVSLHMPLNSETRGMIGADLIGKMKPTAFLINNARGGVLDEQALFDALQGRRIAGAAVDVYAAEPVQTDCPLLTLDNILLTPHSAALTRESLDRMGLMAAEGIDDVLSGREPKHPVA